MSDFINHTLTAWGDRWAGARASGDPTLQQALLIELRSTLYISTMPDQAEQLAAPGGVAEARQPCHPRRPRSRQTLHPRYERDGSQQPAESVDRQRLHGGRTMSDIRDEARQALDNMGKIGEIEWDSYTIPGDRFTAPHSAVAIGEHEVELRWLLGSALVASFIAAAPRFVRGLLAELLTSHEMYTSARERAAEARDWAAWFAAERDHLAADLDAMETERDNAIAALESGAS